MTAATRRPVTVVVPVYGDAESLLACIDGLIATIDQDVDRVLLVNDCGPDADAIEAAVLTAIADQPSFRYARNPQNLGFVGNCNRAALELSDMSTDVLLLNSDTLPTRGWLEAMVAVLNESPDTGIVCARSNNATIASIPFRRRNPRIPRTIERTAAVHEVVAPILPPSSVTPVAMGFCFLVRRELLTEHGLFDEHFAPGYGEENDFCLRMAEHGHLSRMAHHALVHHVGGMSFLSARRDRLRARHELKLVARHPSLPARLHDYQTHGADPVDVFADTWVPTDDRARIVVVVSGAGRDADAAAMRSVASELGGGSALAVCVEPRHLRAARRRFAGVEVVRLGPSNRVWDAAVLTDDRWTSDHAALAPRTVTFGSSLADSVRAAQRIARDPIDVESLRRRWERADRSTTQYRRSPRARLNLRLDSIDPRIRRLKSGLQRRVEALRSR